jgi:hypothetical protein
MESTKDRASRIRVLVITMALVYPSPKDALEGSVIQRV